ncbi:PAS/PAC sensor signal transduction histidine kinase [Candidatus Koribacter versatilis Ellin345]|uniref:histidine kinase n=1 Tax=Koribacter versatilis (strain Ellin345) TaxID=204669 RepID=Q1ITV3_KORVE|nr:PAS domain-containing sensor histidine kinase [Candidatus Koribacter versatilis]ABF39697.1 PAS/PAC sensor signal transduction histidine kinase [Candidatus Koribacter versatilis Ellin345]
MSQNFKPLNPEESVVRLAAIVDSSDDAILGTDTQGTINTWNPAAEKMFGYSADEILGQSVLLLIPPSLHAEHAENFERIARGERIEHYETQRLQRGGGRIDVSFTLSGIRDREGRMLGAAMIARELSAKRRDEAVRARLAAIVESSDDAIIAKDLNGVVTDWNAAAERLFGYKAEDIIGRSILAIIPPELQHEEPVILSKIRAGHRMEHYETHRLHKSGRRLEVSVTISPIRDSSGRVIGASKFARDISEKRRLQTVRSILAAIVESSDDAIVSKNLDGVITSWNAAAERLFGYTAEEIIGQSVLRIIPRELQHEEPGIITRLRAGERIDHYETRRRKKNGESIDVSLTVSPIRDERGTVIGGSKILRDISDRKIAEAAIIEKERFAAAGRLAATLAHEVNNPLEAITNLSYLLSIHEGLDSEAANLAALLLKEVQRAGEITRQTLVYYRESKVPLLVSLREVVASVLRAKRSKLELKNVHVDSALPEPFFVEGYPGELRQVLENLLDNALDAVPDGGHLQIQGSRSVSAANERVLLSICDNGPGIPAELAGKIFEPFFTTKKEKGSGLGLWVSQSIVKKHQGTIEVRSNQENRETVFTLNLPAARLPEPADRRSPAAVS